MEDQKFASRICTANNAIFEKLKHFKFFCLIKNKEQFQFVIHLKNKDFVKIEKYKYLTNNKPKVFYVTENEKIFIGKLHNVFLDDIVYSLMETKEVYENIKKHMPEFFYIKL